MVRALVGAVISIGEGKRTKEWLAQYLVGGQRDFGVFMAPAHPLTLVHVEYPPASEYASRIEKTLKSRHNEPAQAPDGD